jgi:hypothetical protein
MKPGLELAELPTLDGLIAALNPAADLFLGACGLNPSSGTAPGLPVFAVALNCFFVAKTFAG